jgi:cysteine-rich repeat protein
MHRKAPLFLLSFLVGLVTASCVGEESPTPEAETALVTQGTAIVSGTSNVTLCNLPRYTAQTTVQLCGFTTPGSDGSAIDSAWFSVDGGEPLAVVPGNGGFVGTSTTLTEGAHSIRLYARSAAGNLTFEEMPVTVDVTPPMLTVLAPTSADVMTSTVVNVTSSVSDITPVRVQTQWGQSSTVDSGTGTCTHTVDLVNRGHNLLLVRAVDATGNTTEVVVTVYFCPTIDEACFASAHWAPVVVSTNQSSNTVPASGGVTFRVVAGDPQSSLLSYSWTANVGTLGVPAGDSTTSEVVWTPPACVPAGTSPSITATVANAVGGSASTSFSLSGAAVCPPPSICGDGVTQGGEACDDGNTVTESSCPYGQASCSACRADCAAVLNLTGAFCGDGVKNGSEVCDDGNTITESACPSGQTSCTTCNATCTAEIHSLRALLAGTGVGSISSAPAGINCPASQCTALFTKGVAVTLTATPATNSIFTGWSGGGCSGTGSCTVAMTAAASVTASFQPKPVFIITVTSATYGGNCGVPSGNVTSALRTACNGKTLCDYVVDHNVLGDPAPYCAKDYVARWTCNDGSGTVRTYRVEPEAGFGGVARLSCQ